MKEVGKEWGITNKRCHKAHQIQPPIQLPYVAEGQPSTPIKLCKYTTYVSSSGRRALLKMLSTPVPQGLNSALPKVIMCKSLHASPLMIHSEGSISSFYKYSTAHRILLTPTPSQLITTSHNFTYKPRHSLALTSTPSLWHPIHSCPLV